METITSKINKKKFLKWLLLIIWLLFIYYCSSKQGDQSLAMSNRVVDWLKNVFDHTVLYSYNLSFFVRKCAHLSIFFVLGIICYTLLGEYKMMLWQRFLLSFFICVTYACMDELHQVFVADRDGKALDVLLDSCGALLSLIPYFFLSCWFKKKG